MQLRIFTEPQQGASYDQQLAMARVTEEGGFDAFFRSDHYMAFTGDGLPGPTDAWVTLAGLARETSRIRLGTLVSPVTFRWPGNLAISVAEVDAMSGGRVELGLGTGWHDGEHDAYGIPFPPLGERFGMLEEQLEILTGLWATPVGERFSYAGRHYTVTDSPALPKPVQSPRPPIILGGAGAKRTPALVVRHADEYNVPFHPLDATRDRIAAVKEAAEAAGRSPSSLVWSAAQTVCCGRAGEELERRAAAIGRPVDQQQQHGGLAGTPAELVDRIGAFGEAGVERLYFQVLDIDDLDHVRLLAEEVLPQVA